jgi:hypothetical protein
MASSEGGEEEEQFEDYHVTDDEIRDMQAEAKEMFTENPELRSLSDEELEEKGKQDGTDRLMVLRNLLFQRVQQGEISVEEANRLIKHAHIKNTSEAVRKMEVIYEIKKRELESMRASSSASKQAIQEHIQSMRRLQQMIETKRRNITSSTE